MKSSRVRSRVLTEYRRCGQIGLACQLAGVARQTHYVWLVQHADYKQGFEDAELEVVDLIKDEVVSRGITGWLEPVFSSGKRALDFVLDEKGDVVIDPTTKKPKAVPATILKKSDACLLALASAKVPGFSQKASAKVKIGDQDERDIEVTVEYTDKSIPE